MGVGDFYQGSTRWVKSMSLSGGEGSRLSCAVFLPQGPRLGGIPPPRARGSGGETPRPPRSPAPPPRPPAFRPCASVFFAGPALSPRLAMRGHCGGGSRPQAGGKAHGECLGVSPNAAGRGKGGGSELRRQRELSGFPAWGRPLDVKGSQGGNPGHLPANPFAKGGSPGRHTLVTMTIQLQPPVAIAAAYPIRLVSFLFFPGLPLTPSKSPCVQGEGPWEGGGS